MRMSDTRRIRNVHRRHWVPCGAALAAALVIAGCGGGDEQAGKMTSFSTTESAASKAELFSLPADQMAHVEINTVAQAPLPHAGHYLFGPRNGQRCCSNVKMSP